MLFGYLKHGEQALPEAVEIVTRLLLHVVQIELSTEDLFKRGIKKKNVEGEIRVYDMSFSRCAKIYLHAQQSEDDDEEEK